MYLNNSIIKSNNLDQLESYSKNLISMVFCEHNYNKNCNECNINIENKTNVFFIGDYKSVIKKEEFIKVINNLSVSSLNDGLRILIIKGLDKATIVAQNVLLTWIENINSQLILILLTININNVIQTVKSRLPIYDIGNNYNPSPLTHKEEEIFKILINPQLNLYINLYNEFIQLDNSELINILNKLAINVLQYKPDKKSISQKILKTVTILENTPHLNKKILIEKLLNNIMNHEGKEIKC